MPKSNLRNPDDYTGYYTISLRPNGNVGVANDKEDYRDDITPLLYKDLLKDTFCNRDDIIAPDNWSITLFEQDKPNISARHFPTQAFQSTTDIENIVAVMQRNTFQHSGLNTYVGIGFAADIGKHITRTVLKPDDDTERQLSFLYYSMSDDITQTAFGDVKQDRGDLSWTLLSRPTPRSRKGKEDFAKSIHRYSKLETMPISMTMVLSEDIYSNEGHYVDTRPIASVTMNGDVEWHCKDPFDKKAKGRFVNLSGPKSSRCGSEKTKRERYAPSCL